MEKKQIIIIFSSVLVASYAGFFLYQRYQRKKADEAVDSYEEALKKLKEAKETLDPLYTEPEIVIDEAGLPDAITMADTKLWDLEYGYA